MLSPLDLSQSGFTAYNCSILVACMVAEHYSIARSFLFYCAARYEWLAKISRGRIYKYVKIGGKPDETRL